MQTQRNASITVSVKLDVEVDERVWAQVYGAGDAYDEAQAQRRRSLVADVEDYVTNQIAASQAATEGAIRSVDLRVARR